MSQDIVHDCRYTQELFIDAPDVMFSKVIPCNSLDEHRTLRKSFNHIRQNPIVFDSLNKYFEIITTIRDSSLSDLLIRYLEQDLHPYLTCQLIYTLSQTGGAGCRDAVLPFLVNPNDVIRQYGANAAGFIFRREDTLLIDKYIQDEKNCYVTETLIVSRKRLTNTHNSSAARPTLPNNIDSGFTTYTIGKDGKAYGFMETAQISSARVPMETEFVYPHQQYKKMSDSHLYRRISYGVSNEAGSIHVGEDSGWELSGLPVHSITAGVVVFIMYESSWGHLVAIETKAKDGKIYNHYYGHLSNNIDVEAGQSVRCGQKIGEIGPTWSLMVGGYRAHLHLGIARGRNSVTGTKGYYSHTRLWHNPISFLYARVK